MQSSAPAAAGPLDGGAAACTDPVDAAACILSGTCSDGSGDLADPSPSCDLDAGAVPTYASPSDVAAAMVGLWTACEAGLSSLGNSVQFTADGHFSIWQSPPSIAAEWANFITPPSDLAESGLFVVVDASATLGPGTFEAQFSFPSGEVATAQVVAFTSPPRVRFFAPPNVIDYGPVVTAQYQAGVCGPSLGPIVSLASDADMLARLQGRWAVCGNQLSNGLLSIFEERQGIEFPGDGSWHYLVEVDGGQLVPSTAPADQGTIQAGPGGPPYSVVMNSDATPIFPILDACGGLTFGQGAPGEPNGAFGYAGVTQELRRIP
jgi:hypothetical protein